MSTLELVEPRFSHIPGGVRTDGDEVAGLCADAGYGPDGEQRVCLDGIFAKDEHGKSSSFSIALIACRQNLKCLDAATPLLTTRGWAALAEIRAGDEVFHPGGYPVRVSAASVPELGHDCYRVATTDGRSVVTDGEHLWRVYDTRQRRGRLVTTAAMAGDLDRYGPRTAIWQGKRYATREYRYHLPVQEPLKSRDRALPVDAYLLGGWLGDGKSGGGVIHCHASDVEHWAAEISRAGFTPSRHVRRTCTDVGITWRGRKPRVYAFMTRLRELGVLGNKHIPEMYLTAGPGQREALLQGLLDTDGTIHHRSGQVTFTSTLRGLAEGVLFLARSLGWRAGLGEGRAVLDGRDCGPKFTVTFTPKADDSFAPFRLARKAARVRSGGRNGRFTVSIASVEPVESRAVRCIQVDSPDGLYLAGRDLVATHNTAIEKQACLGWLFLYHCDPIIWTGHEWDTVAEHFMDLDKIISGYSWLSRQIRSVNRAQRDMEIITKRGGRMIFKTRTPDGGAGLSGEKVVLDEGWKIRRAHISALMPTMSARSMTGDPQVIYGSSAAHEESEVLHRLVERGRKAATSPAAARLERRFMFVEWCAPDPAQACARGERCEHELDTPGCGCDNPELIQQANPAVGRRIAMDYILGSERREMLPHDFGRERMGWHDKPLGLAKVIPLTQWADGLDPESEPAGPVALAVVYSSDRRRAAIGLAGRRADRTWHVEIADVVSPAQVVLRVGQIIARALDTSRPVCAIGVDRGGFESECIRGLLDLREVELDGQDEPVTVTIRAAAPDDLEWGEGRPVVLVRMSGPEVATAYSGFVTSVTHSRDLFHRGQDDLTQDDLTVALMVATSRDVGDAGQAWGRRKSGGDIAPLVAVTQARWVHEEKAPLEEIEPGVWAL